MQHVVSKEHIYGWGGAGSKEAHGAGEILGENQSGNMMEIGF